jgi:hypothetical protein
VRLECLFFLYPTCTETQNSGLAAPMQHRLDNKGTHKTLRPRPDVFGSALDQRSDARRRDPLCDAGPLILCGRDDAQKPSKGCLRTSHTK